MLQYLKSGSWQFLRFFSKIKNKFRVSEDFSYPLAKYIFSKVFIEGVNYISGYLPKSE